MSFWESKKIKKTRKIHRCAYCGGIISVGSSCNNEVGTYEGDFDNYYLDKRCISFMDLFTDKSETELGNLDDDLANSDLLDCPICGKSNHSEYEFKENKQSLSLECDDCGNRWVLDLSLEAIEKLKIMKRGASKC